MLVMAILVLLCLATLGNAYGIYKMAKAMDRWADLKWREMVLADSPIVYHRLDEDAE